MHTHKEIQTKPLKSFAIWEHDVLLAEPNSIFAIPLIVEPFEVGDALSIYHILIKRFLRLRDSSSVLTNDHQMQNNWRSERVVRHHLDFSVPIKAYVGVNQYSAKLEVCYLQ